jgi:acetoin utilization deacetylase AcuC-like enzyme
MPQYKKYITAFYNPNMVPQESILGNFSQSPYKPKLFMDYITSKPLLRSIRIESNFPPFTEADFLIAHTKEYVNAVFNGIKPLCESNNLNWSNDFAKSLLYTNSSLYHAIKNSLENPGEICFSPTSGFHHAKPTEGMGFCTFSGQVIASIKLWREYKMRGVYLDLDGHYGNSIEDSREMFDEINDAVPIGCNYNPKGRRKSYLEDLESYLQKLKTMLMNEEVHYIVHCKGADSHKDDDMMGQLTTAQWLKASKLVYNFVSEVSASRNKLVPLTICLFGGYRDDCYNKVLELHYKDLLACKNVLLK